MFAFICIAIFLTQATVISVISLLLSSSLRPWWNQLHSHEGIPTETNLAAGTRVLYPREEGEVCTRRIVIKIDGNWNNEHSSNAKELGK